MAIQIEREPSCFDSADAELCIFCNTPTRFWNVEENKPVCESCAKHFTLVDVKNHNYELN